jgi:superfamily II DNA helicase RecQ
MDEQIEYLRRHGISAAVVAKDKDTETGAQMENITYWYTSPEMILGQDKWRKILKSPLFQLKMRLVVIDEAHLVTQWWVVLFTYN